MFEAEIPFADEDFMIINHSENEAWRNAIKKERISL